MTCGQHRSVTPDRGLDRWALSRKKLQQCTVDFVCDDNVTQTHVWTALIVSYGNAYHSVRSIYTCGNIFEILETSRSLQFYNAPFSWFVSLFLHLIIKVFQSVLRWFYVFEKRCHKMKHWNIFVKSWRGLVIVFRLFSLAVSQRTYVENIFCVSSARHNTDSETAW